MASGSSLCEHPERLKQTQIEGGTIQSAAMQRPLSGDRAFSFRQDFADAWYDLHNPDQTGDHFFVSFDTRHEDFPPTLSNITIQHVVLYVFSTTDNLVDLADIEMGWMAPRSVGGQLPMKYRKHEKRKCRAVDFDDWQSTLRTVDDEIECERPKLNLKVSCFAFVVKQLRCSWEVVQRWYLVWGKGRFVTDARDSPTRSSLGNMLFAFPRIKRESFISCRAKEHG
jgi:hypothetical protein